MFKFVPSESAGFMASRLTLALKPGILKFLDEADIPITAKNLSILTVLAAIDSPDQMNWKN
ncbi:MAG: hypothetical protein K0U86_00670 [Planctomycetes bacterium]|nr:hypothetical protein [Planctomycetota bacterium]MCH9723400.1 hypothetical protein [Planctomycetota bacterium]MCH9777287.1 hypothetical protein [Planctomycetota bacterium]